MEHPTCECAIRLVNLSIMNFPKVKVNEARVVDFSDIQRKEDVNEVSKLSKWSTSAICFCGPYLSWAHKL